MRFLIVAAMIVAAVDVQACSCSRPSAAEQFASADLAFAGEVVDVEDRYHFFRRLWWSVLALLDRDPFMELSDYETYTGLEFTFAVERTWRGPASKTIRVVTGRGGGDCGVPFERGKRYLVYGYKSAHGEWHTNICTRTRPADAAAEDLAFLNAMR
jgi:hypothetical protein